MTVRLRQNRTGELRALLEPLLQWMFSYRSPEAAEELDAARRAFGRADTETGRAVGSDATAGHESFRSAALWRDESARPAAMRDPRTRIMDAAAKIASERGYSALSINEIDRIAGVSHHTFRKHFASKGDAFIAAYQADSRDNLAYCLKAFSSEQNWSAAVHAGLAAELRFLGQRPELARIGFLEVYAAGPEALELRSSELKMFGTALEPGYEVTGRRAPPHIVVSEAIAGGIFQLARECILHDGPEHLPQLTPAATYAALAPFIGWRAAAATAVAPLAGPLA